MKNFFYKESTVAYLFISPFFIFFLTFFTYPLFNGIVMSFYRWNGITSKFIGVKNYVRLLYNDDVFKISLINTLFFVFVSIFIINTLAFFLALLLNSKFLKFKNLYRSIFFTPITTASVIIALFFLLFFNESFGLLNYILDLMGMKPIPWFTNGLYAKLFIVFIMIFRWTGVTCIYFLAGLQSIPNEYYESAKIDGANLLQVLFKITLPILRPITFLVTIIVLIGSMQIFDAPTLTTDGGPGNSTLTIAMYQVTQGVNKLRFGYSSAVGSIIFAITLLIVSLYMLYEKNKQ